MADVSFSFAGASLLPLPCGALFWPAENALLVADLHLEKASWFASHGQPLPPFDSVDTLHRIAAAVAHTGATRLFALGDSFHDANGPARLPAAARALLATLLGVVGWTWIGGNHDGLCGGALGGHVADEVVLAGITLRHEADPADPAPEISGHWHPKVHLQLRTGRRLVRRCFALAPGKLVLPAYGALTGGLAISDPALAAAMAGPITALIPLRTGLLRTAA
jgi:uncharacterized protein